MSNEQEEKADLVSEESSSEHMSDRLGPVGLDSDSDEANGVEAAERELDDGKIKDMTAWGHKKEEFYAKEEQADSSEEFEEEQEA